jgi:predicted transcriptional regulator
MNNKLILGPLEQDVMDCVWDNKRATVREVYTCLKKNRKIAYTTVMTVMARLVEKKYLNRKMKEKTYTYTPKVSKTRNLQRTLSNITKYILDNFGEEAVVSFVEELDVKSLSEEKRKEIISKLQHEI